MGLLLDAAYLAAGLVASPWLLYKAATDGRYRHRLGERFGGLPVSDGGRVLWFHCASVGEVNLIRPLVGRLRSSHPDLAITVTTLTRAGRENAERSLPGARVAYFPLDFTGAVRRGLRRVNPAGVVLVELEVWPNFVAACARRGVPVALVNGRVTERSFARYRRLRWLFGSSFRALAAAGAQSEAHAERLRELGASPVVTGNLKFDAAIAFDAREAQREWRRILGLGEAPVLVAGSTHDPEERILVETYRRLRQAHPALRLVLAPRHLERLAEVEKVVEASGLRCYKRSRFGPPGPSGEGGDGVILLDTVGELARLYAAATAVFIGGTFCARGGQNMLEPAALGKPIVSGPSLSNFEDVARALVEAGGMRVFDNPVHMGQALDELLRNPEGARAAGRRAAEAVRAGRGAIDRTLRLIEGSLLKGP
jgi:3-deoxy-D-manno-octulosonic-acid transferase